jgi:hypothetical protein
MATIYVVHDQFGEILSIVPEAGDEPVAGSDVQVTEVPVSGEIAELEVAEVARRFHVDVRANELVEGPLEHPRQD